MELIQVSVQVVILIDAELGDLFGLTQVEIVLSETRPVEQFVVDASEVAVVTLFSCLELDICSAEEEFEVSGVTHALFRDEVVEVVLEHLLRELTLLDLDQLCAVRVLLLQFLRQPAEIVTTAVHHEVAWGCVDLENPEGAKQILRLGLDLFYRDDRLLLEEVQLIVGRQSDHRKGFLRC